MRATETQRFIVDIGALPANYPTHLHDAIFWEWLGRTIATFGFLEEVLGRAIFAFTSTTVYPECEVQGAFENWLPTLERALTDPLGGLIAAYRKAVKANQNATTEDLDGLIERLREASNLRNVLCHGSWRKPDSQGRSLPLYISKKKEIFETRVDVEAFDLRLISPFCPVLSASGACPRAA
jgi:hypothetical protein